jgi:acid phosphatase
VLDRLSGKWPRQCAGHSIGRCWVHSLQDKQMPHISVRSPAVALAVCVASSLATAQGLPATPPDHVVILVMENHAASQIIGSAAAPYINKLAGTGALFSQSFAVAHPSQPNYLALFSGSTHGLTSDRCPLSIQGPNLAQQLLAAGRTFVGYSENLPSAGYTGCSASGGYARKHAPWVNFGRLPPGINQPFTAFAATDFSRLPTVSFVVPNMGNDMHDGTVGAADAWLLKNIGAYADWAMAHNGLLIVTWDEDDGQHGNQIATLFHGPMVKRGVYPNRITHYDVLRTVEALFGLPYAGEAASATTITNVW